MAVPIGDIPVVLRPTLTEWQPIETCPIAFPPHYELDLGGHVCRCFTTAEGARIVVEFDNPGPPWTPLRWLELPP